MARKNKDRSREEGGRPPKLPAVDKAAEAEADRLFLEAMADLGPVPVKDRALDRLARQEREAREERSENRPAKGAEPLRRLDLHHCTLPEARGRVDGFLQGLLTNLRAPVTVQIITGKGRHSGPGGAVLAREIHRHVRERYASRIVAIDDSPVDVVVGDLPIRGHFNVTFN